MANVDSKVCTGCNLDLPLSEFNKNKKCKNGILSRCKACVRKYRDSKREMISAKQREYREAHREEIAAWQREYYEENRATISAQQREYYEANREKLTTYSREYHESHREQVIAATRRWREANPDKRREYRQNNRGRSLDYSHRRRARMRESAVVPFRQEELFQRMAYFGHKCWMCGGPFEHVDHVKPISKGGPHILSNLRPACRSCNFSKGAKWPLEGVSFNAASRE